MRLNKSPELRRQAAGARATRIVRGVAVAVVKAVADWMAERRMTLAALVAASGLDERIVEAIAAGRYTPSPQQRQRLAQVLAVGPEQVAWGHQTEVAHVYGHGPQFGRSP
jgi:hypothetical protein